MVDSEAVAGVQFMLYFVTIDVDLKVCVVLCINCVHTHLCINYYVHVRGGDGW